MTCILGHVRNWLHWSSTNNSSRISGCWDCPWQKESKAFNGRHKGLLLYIVKWYLLLREIDSQTTILSLIFNNRIVSKLFVSLIWFWRNMEKSSLCYSIWGVPTNHISFSLFVLFYQDRSKHLSSPIVEVHFFSPEDRFN